MLEGPFLVRVIVQYICLLFSLCLHEASHAAMADRCGDPSARFLGRVSLNPLAHIDPIGTVVMPLLMISTGIPLIGWAKPVPVNPGNFRNIRRDQVLVALAGPGANLVLAVAVAILLRIGILLTSVSDLQELIVSPVLGFGFNLVLINLALLAFNLIPVPPLDGSWVLHYFLPPSGQRALEQIGPYGILLVLFLGRPLLAVPFSLLFTLLELFLFWG